MVATDTVDVTETRVPLCSIGAWAGGVTALRRLFQNLPDDLGLAYVVIVHLAPEHPSALAEVLSACTTMQVHQGDDAPRLRPNCVYVIPPDRELVIEDDRVMAREFSQPRGQRAPIDMFFRSVAAARGDGIAVVLSGSGSDGSIGVRAVHEAGGVVFVQDPAEAEFPQMPQNAIATGVVSYVAPISRMAELIAEVARSREAVRSLDHDDAAIDLRAIIGFLHARTGHDFSGYKRATVMRRVLRRVQVCRSPDLSGYSALLKSSPEEARELYDDLLISVTQFFRDEAAFQALATKVVAPLFEQQTDGGDTDIRVWSVGCATGEEAYSLAILLLEEARRRQVRTSIQIFASDLDDSALNTAREGRYPRSIEADVSDERLRRYFVDEGTNYRIHQDVREMVLFASHNILKNPPFLRIDLIACRNLLIYLEKSLQEQLLTLFHYALKPEGSLFLGPAETADLAATQFVPLDRQHRLYIARPKASLHVPVLPQAPIGDRPQVPTGRRAIGSASGGSPAERHGAKLEQAAPPCVLVDETRHILYLSPTAGRFILHSGGTFSGSLPDVVRPELRLDLKAALDQALLRKRPTLTLAVPVSFDGGDRRVALHVAPGPAPATAGPQALVVFLDAGPVLPDADAELDISTQGNDEVRRLRAEVRELKGALAASRREQETAIEDLRAANEELQSINEEYRSASEGLETSKEAVLPGRPAAKACPRASGRLIRGASPIRRRQGGAPGNLGSAATFSNCPRPSGKAAWRRAVSGRDT